MMGGIVEDWKHKEGLLCENMSGLVGVLRLSFNGRLLFSVCLI